MPTLVVLNPVSRSGATGRRWRAIEGRVRDTLGELRVEPTRAPRDAERIAREAASRGVERIVIAGGDGTLSEVATGLLAADLAHRVTLGVLPLGTGGDFVRTLGVPHDVDAALAILLAGKSRSIDAGRLHYRDADGRGAATNFVNVASLGISGLTDRIVNRSSKRLGGRLSFLVGTVRAVAEYRSRPVTLRVDGETVCEGPVILAAVANGRCFGGGMQVAPRARPDDGLLDVVVVSHLSKPRLLAKLPSIYRGAHLDDPAVTHTRGRVIEADAEPGTVWLDVDGEGLGTLPARFEILPSALTLIGPAA